MKINLEPLDRFLLSLIFLGILNYGWADRVDDTSINDQWRFSYYGSNAGAGTEGVSFNDSSWDTVNLPHTWNALDTQDGVLSNYARGFGWYRKHVTIGSEYYGRRVYLFFEAVGKKAHVYCNGTLVGNHLGAYAAFCYDITDHVIFGGDNVIAVRADNANTSSVSSLNIIPRSGDFNQYGGICRKVHLIITDPVHITLLDYASPGVYLTPTNVSASSADLEVKALVRNAGTNSQSVTVRAKIYDAAGVLIDTLQKTQSVSAGSTQAVTQNTQISNPHLWNGVADPYLYKVITEVEVNSVVVDSVRQPLGFRYYSVDPDQGFFLNGRYLDLHGVAMHEDRRDKGRAISDGDREQDMALMAEMGCNWIRPSHYQHAEKFYDLADEYGIVLSTEIPIVNGIEFSTDFVNNCKDQLRELIRQNYNHPSVFFWLLYNELTTSGSETVIQQLHNLAKAEDPTRLTTVAHNNTSDTAAWSYITDTLAYNRYMGWYGGSPEGFVPWADGIHALRSTDEIGIMEYGAGANAFQHEIPPVYPGPTSPWHPEEYQSYYHEVYWKAMKVRPFLWCKTIWNGFDFSVDWRNEGSQPELNDKGMVTRDRTLKKDTFYWYKANWTTEPMVYITSRRFTPRTACPQYVKVYSNCDTVELFVNEISMGRKTGSDRIFLWTEANQLNLGDNEIRAVGVSGGNEYTDTCIWQFEIVNDFPVASVTASHYETQNPPENTIDGNFGTRWAGDNYPWIKYDLGSVQNVDKVGISFYRGNERVYTFDIEASNDDVNWTPILVNETSSGTTTAIEEFDLGITARYIRIDGKGNTGPYPAWSSYYEVEFYGNLNPDCAFMRSLNCGYVSDFSGPGGQPDCAVNIFDFAVIADRWMDDYRQTIAPVDPGTVNLIAHWPLDGDYNDATGNGYDAVPGTSPVFDEGHIGQSVYFDGADNVSYLNCSNSTGINLDQGGTISAWIKSSDLIDPWASVITKGVSAWRLIRNNTASSISFHFNAAGGGEYQANGSTPVLDGQWHHLVSVYDGSQVRLYVDGWLDASGSAGPVNTTGDPVYIGSRVNSTATRNWIGNIDDVRIYDTALSEAHILYLAEKEAYQQIPDPPLPMDLVLDGTIDLDDLAAFLRQWLLCNDPQDPSCIL